MKNQNNELAVLHDLSKEIVGAMSVEDVCRRILDKTVKALKVSKASIMKMDNATKELKIIAAIGLPKDIIKSVSVKVGEGISGKVFKSAKPVLIQDLNAVGYKSRKRYKSKSLMSAPVTSFPMQVRKLPIGVINVTDKKGKVPFTKDDLSLLTTIANQTAAYLYLCDLIEESKKVEILKREIDLARSIQQGLLPKWVPHIKGFDIAGRCLTAEHVGGDYFDFLIGGARPPSVVVADVSGHSVGAALTMSAFRSAVRTEGGPSLLSPAIVAERLNAILYDDLCAAEQFISMVYLQILPGREKTAIKYTTAGHHPPLLLRGHSFINHSTEDMLLGVERFAEYHDRRIDIQNGDVILLYTDGLLAAVGLDRVKNIVRTHQGQSAQKIVENLCGEARRQSRNRPLLDDITVVVIKK
jgi:sigma-B regulation protein RsbU (phosphoserine phosphatase)